MTIVAMRGDLLASNAAALVNTVNTVGVMGAGLARAFRDRYPTMFAEYRARCRRGQVRVGQIDTHVVDDVAGTRFVLNFPTKQHWRDPSRLEWIQPGLDDLVSIVRQTGIEHIAIPPLGCGLGGLRWADVRPLIEATFAHLPQVDVELYEPAR